MLQNTVKRATSGVEEGRVLQDINWSRATVDAMEIPFDQIAYLVLLKRAVLYMRVSTIDQHPET